jgi:phage terminase large subunit-like protein
VQETVTATAGLDGPLVPIVVEQEPGSASLYHIDNLVDALPGFAVVGRPSTGSKLIRARPVSSAAEHGKVYLIRGEWNRAFLQELEYFPDGAHDDQVDALSGAHAALTELIGVLESHEGSVVTYNDEVQISPI